jgi:hypothetical protein
MRFLEALTSAVGYLLDRSEGLARFMFSITFISDCFVCTEVPAEPLLISD